MELCYRVIYNPGLQPVASVPATVNYSQAKPESETPTSEPAKGMYTQSAFRLSSLSLP